MKALDIIRLIGGEFADIPTETLEKWIEIVRPMVSRKQFGKLYEQALALLVCHKLKLGGAGSNPLGPLGAIGVGFSLGSVSEGGSSISFGSSQSSNLADDAELGLTVYGVQYLSLRRMVIVPIHISGEDTLGLATRRRRKRPPPPERELPPATDTELGAVRVRPGSGLKLDEDGSLSVDVEGIVAGTAPEPGGGNDGG